MWGVIWLGILRKIENGYSKLFQIKSHMVHGISAFWLTLPSWPVDQGNGPVIDVMRLLSYLCYIYFSIKMLEGGELVAIKAVFF